MTIIKSTEIPYLKKEVLELYNNVTVIGADGGRIKMNSLILCAVSQFLKNAFHEDNEEHTIVTEFSFEELKQMKEYCIRGSCNVMAESILQAFGLLKEAKIRLTSDKFKIDSKPPKHNTSSCNPTSKIKTLENSFIGEEFLDVKDEPLSDMEFDFENYSDNPNALPALTKASGSKRKQNFIIKDEDDDEDWEPKKNSNIKTKLSDNQKKRGPPKGGKLSETDLVLYKTFDLPKSLEDYKAQAKHNKGFVGKFKETNINDLTLTIQCEQCVLQLKVYQILQKCTLNSSHSH